MLSIITNNKIIPLDRTTASLGRLCKSRLEGWCLALAMAAAPLGGRHVWLLSSVASPARAPEPSLVESSYFSLFTVVTVHGACCGRPLLYTPHLLWPLCPPTLFPSTLLSITPSTIISLSQLALSRVSSMTIAALRQEIEWCAYWGLSSEAPLHREQPCFTLVPEHTCPRPWTGTPRLRTAARSASSCSPGRPLNCACAIPVGAKVSNGQCLTRCRLQ